VILKTSLAANLAVREISQDAEPFFSGKKTRQREKRGRVFVSSGRRIEI
jgi:hypothetical protein